MNTTITQSLATGMPVVATNHSGFPDQVKNGINGYLSLEANPEDLAQKILLYMEHPETWAEMSRASRKHALENYNSQELIAKQIECYEKILEDTKNTAS